MEGIQVSVEVSGNQNQISIIKVGGYIDTTTSSEVERALNALLKQGRYQVIVDLGNVDYISSAGWGIFISEIKTIRENYGDLKLVRMIPDVYEIFELLEFHHILDVYDSTQEAIGKFEESDRIGVKEKQPLYKDEVPTRYAEPEPPKEEKESLINEKQFEPEFEPRSAAELPLEEKIKYIIVHNPAIGAFKISRKLNSLEFGYTSVRWLTVRKLLKQYKLIKKMDRLAFARENRNQYLF